MSVKLTRFFACKGTLSLQSRRTRFLADKRHSDSPPRQITAEKSTTSVPYLGKTPVPVIEAEDEGPFVPQLPIAQLMIELIEPGGLFADSPRGFRVDFGVTGSLRIGLGAGEVDD